MNKYYLIVGNYINNYSNVFPCRKHKKPSCKPCRVKPCKVKHTKKFYKEEEEKERKNFNIDLSDFDFINETYKKY